MGDSAVEGEAEGYSSGKGPPPKTTTSSIDVPAGCDTPIEADVGICIQLSVPRY